MIADKMVGFVRNSSVIRAMFEEGKKMAAEFGPENVYDFSLGNPSVPAPPVVTDTLRELLESTPAEALHAYTSSAGDPAVREAIAGYVRRSFGFDAQSEYIYMTAGAAASLTVTLNALTEPGDEVIVPTYTYTASASIIYHVGATPVMIDCKQDSYEMDYDKVEEAITPKTKAIILNNPSNPTGYVLSPEEMRTLADIAIENNLYLIADEVYREFAYGDRIPESFSLFKDLEEHLVLVDSASKRFSACGARVGCVITRNKELQQAILKFCQSRLSVATLDQIGATALYSVDKEFFAKSKEEYKQRRDTVVQGLRQIPGVTSQIESSCSKMRTLVSRWSAAAMLDC